MSLNANSPIITIVGNSATNIENFTSIVCYEDNELKLKTTDGIIRIEGNSLSISYMDNEEILIKGFITNISFADGTYGG